MYQNILTKSRLGTGHDSLESYTDAISKCQQSDEPKEFSLVVVLSPDANNNGDCNKSNISILLGKKLRGFGKGFYNSLGGKLEKSEVNHPAKGAVRELLEESGIQIELSVMEESYVGIINFTFEDSDVNRSMRVHLYCVFVSISNDENEQSTKQQRFANNIVTTIRPDTIRGCDEISPEWFHDIHNIPLDNMFADDSIWLTKLLSHYNVSQDDIPPHKLQFDAWFHFQPGGTDTNTIMHHYIKINNGINTIVPEKMSLEKRLFHELHANHIHSPSIKEFKENFAFANAVRSSMKDEERMEYVLDVAGGHGALAALFLLLVPNCHTAVVIDPAQCTSGKNGVREAWSQFWNDDSNEKELRYRHECLRTGLRKELDTILQSGNLQSTNITVVACHACQHLSDETLEIAAEYGVNVAVLPCCQKDHDGWWKGLTKRLVKGSTIPIGVIMDLLAAGKMMAWDTGLSAGVRYEVKMKLMKESISPQNRMILCKAIRRDDENEQSNNKIERKKALAHEKLQRAYHAAHKLPSNSKSAIESKSQWCSSSLLTGFCLGSILSFLIASQIARKSR